MNTFLRYCVGLDISKDTLQVCLSVIDASGRVTVKATTKVVNKPTGFTALRNWAVRHRKLDLPLTYLMESTGVYHEAVAWHLHQHDQQVSILLPNKAKHYLKSLGYKSKNDKIDAQGLSRMGLDGAARAAAAADLETAFQESLCPSAADAPAPAAAGTQDTVYQPAARVGA